MVAPTSFAARVATFLLSVSAHGAVALVTVGAHGAKEASSGAPLADRTIEIAAPEPIAADLPQSSTTPATTPEPFAKFPSHKHPYPVAVNHDAIPHDPSLRHPPITVAAAEPVTADAPDPASPPALAASAIEAPRFVLTVGHDHRAPDGVNGVGGGAQPGTGSNEAVAEEAVDRPATLISGAPPAYTRQAEAAGVEADVPLEIVVDTRGAVVGARVLTAVGYGLDDAALLGIRAYRFAPALRGGRAVAVRMRWLMRFQLR